MTRALDAVEQIMDKLRGMKFVMTPEEHQLLGLTPEDVGSFSDPDLLLDASEMSDSIQEIVSAAYKEVPAFRKMVEDDQRRSPGQFPYSSRVVSRFLKHLRGTIPPESVGWIQPDTYAQARGMVERSLTDQLPKKEVAEQKKYEALQPLSDDDLRLFNMKRSQITPDVQFGDLKTPLYFFLGLLKDENGKTVKNELTSKMPDDLRTGYLFRLFREIRDLKLSKNKKLSVYEQRWLGRDLPQLERMTQLLVQNAHKKGKDPIRRGDDLLAIQSDVQAALNVIKRLLSSLKKADLRENLVKIGDIIDTSLPASDLISDRIKSIQDAANEAGLSAYELPMLLEIDLNTLQSTPAITKDKIDSVKKELMDVDKGISTQGETPELKNQRANLVKRLEVAENLSTRDFSKLFKAIQDYMDTLSAYRSALRSNLSEDRMKNIPELKTIRAYMDQLSAIFKKLVNQDVFRSRWQGQPGRLIRPEGTPAPGPQETPAAPLQEKAAAIDIENYSKKLEKFRGGGVRKILDGLVDFTNDTEEGLEFLKDKMLSIMEAGPGVERVWDRDKQEWSVKTPGNVLNPTQKDFRGNPMGGEGPSVEDMKKKIETIGGSIKKLNLSRKKDEASDILEWAANLKNHISAQSKNKTKKLAISQYLRGIYDRVLSAAESPASQSPSSDVRKRLRPTSEAGWLVYRDRITKMGKKSTRSFFAEPTFVPQLVEAMEAAGLNAMVTRGVDVKAVDIDPVLESVIQKASGKKGSFDNILGDKFAQELRSEIGIEKKKKEMEEADARVQSLNSAIEKTDEKYLPILSEFSRFLKDPLGALKRRLEQRKAPAPSPEKTRSEPKPVEVSKANYQLALRSLLDKYPRGVSSTKTAAETPMLPTDEYRRILGVSEQLRDKKKGIEAEKNPVKRARLVKEYLESSLESVGKAQDYLNSYRPTLEADRVTIDNLEAYLASEEAKRDPDASGVRDQLSTLKGNFGHEYHVFSFMNDLVKKAEDKISKSKPQEYLSRLTRDLGDNKVEELYSVATAPELNVSKDEARAIEERAKEHEKGLGFIIDRSTYKKNMNRLMVRQLELKKVTDYKGEGKSYALPSERTEEYLRKSEQMQGMREDINKTTDEKNKLRKEQHFYKTLVDIYEGMSNERKSLSDKMKDLQDVQKNIAYLEENKSKMPADEYSKGTALISSLLNKYDIKSGALSSAIKMEEKHLEEFEQRVKDLEKDIPGYQQRLKEVEDQLARGGTPKERTPQQLKEHLNQLKIENMAIMTRANMTMDQRNQRRLEIEKEIEDVEKKLAAPVQKVAAIEDTRDPMSTFEKALDEKGIEPASITKDLPKPKGWNLLENYFDKARKEMIALRDKDPKEIRKSDINRLEELKRTLPVIDAYKKQLVQIGPEAVPLKEVVSRFEDLMLEYNNQLRKYNNQREDAISKTVGLAQEVELIEDLYDPETGEFKGLPPEEIKNIKNIFFRTLYRYMDWYWSNRVGKNISVFGDRDTTWYDNVFRTFRGLSGVRSNKKLMGLLNQYKEATRSDFPKDVSSRPNKIEVLGRREKEIEDRLKELGQDPARSEELSNIRTQLSTLIAQKGQIDKIFNEMSASVQAAVHEKIKESLEDKITGGRKPKGTDLSKKIDESSEGVVKIMETELNDLVQGERVMDQIDLVLGKKEKELGIKPPAAPAEKKAYNKLHPDFNIRILYGSLMQRMIAEIHHR